MIVSDVNLNVGAYLGFYRAESDQEKGFGTRKVIVNEAYHTVQGEYATKSGNNFRYSGQTLNGVITGLGHMTFYEKKSSNSVISGKYEGRFENDKFHGDGRFEDLRVGSSFEFIGTYEHHKRRTGKSYKITRTCSEKWVEEDKQTCDG